MEKNIIIAGVGGQGILTIATILDLAAMHAGLNIKQAEVHGMSQRGGEVQTHLRISDGEIFSDLIPMGQTDLILSVEPLEALRYLPYLKANGAIVTSDEPFKNIPNYPDENEVISTVKKSAENVVFVEATKIKTLYIFTAHIFKKAVLYLFLNTLCYSIKTKFFA